LARLKELIRNAGPLHQRAIEVKSYAQEDGHLIVEGWLRDDRFVDGYTWAGEKRPKGVVHWIGVRLLIGGWPITIEAAEAEMMKTPHELCPTTVDTIERLVGLHITSGYTDRVKALLGGTEGCIHLSHLVGTMGSAAIHGYWTQHSRERRPLPGSLDEMEGLAVVIDSCRLWKKDGPLINGLREMVEGVSDKDT
jgi:hypothetical protein